MMLRVFVILAAIGLMLAVHQRFGEERLPQPKELEETLPSLQAVKLLALNYPSAWADYYWLRTLSHFGDDSMHQHRYPNLMAFMERVLHLDPYFINAYHFAGTALTLREFDYNHSLEFLERGMHFRPDDWRIAFYQGFNAYYFANDFDRAAKALTHAARAPGAPSYIGALATRVAAEANDPRVGLALVDEMLENVNDEDLRNDYLKRRSLLLLEVQLRELQREVDNWMATTGEKLTNLRQLHMFQNHSGPIHDPMGGEFFLDAQGRVQTTSEKQRLRIYGKTQARKKR